MPGRVRSIPACAGNTAHGLRGRLARAVHPRVRGEHRSGAIKNIEHVRSIPACAGNTQELQAGLVHLIGPSPRARGTLHYPANPGFLTPVHPRVRGEHSSGWGARPPRPRSIPACAGNTVSVVTGVVARRGPSPRARGTPRLRLVGHRPNRSIPACAGNTLFCINRLADFKGLRCRLRHSPAADRA